MIEPIVKTRGIDCAWERRPAYAYAEDGTSIGNIEKEVEAAQDD